MLVDNLKIRLKQAMRQNNTTEKNILRVVLGDIQTIASTKNLSESQIEEIIYKRMDGNDELLDFPDKDGSHENVMKENSVLQDFVPRTMTSEQIEAFITLHVLPEVVREKDVNKACGAAIKALKNAKMLVRGKRVKKVVDKIRHEHAL